MFRHKCYKPIHTRKTHHAYNMKECVFLLMLIERTLISKLALKTIVWRDTISGEGPTNTFLCLTCVQLECSQPLKTRVVCLTSRFITKCLNLYASSLPLFQSQAHTMKQSVSIRNGVSTRCQYQSKHFTFLHILHSPCLLIRLRRNGGWTMTNRRLSKFFRRFIFAERRFASIKWRKNFPEAATPSPFCVISPSFPPNRGVRFDEKQPSFDD